MSQHIDIVFRERDRSGHRQLEFVEVEDDQRRSLRLGVWVDRDDGCSVLRIPDPRRVAELEQRDRERRDEIGRAVAAALEEAATDLERDGWNPVGDWLRERARNIRTEQGISP